MANLGVTWETLLVIAGGIVVLFDAIKRLRQLSKPISDIKEQQKKLEEKQELGEKKLDRLECALGEMTKRHERASAVIGLAVAELLNHTITGNDVERLKEKEDELNRFFYK